MAHPEVAVGDRSPEDCDASVAAAVAASRDWVVLRDAPEDEAVVRAVAGLIASAGRRVQWLAGGPWVADRDRLVRLVDAGVSALVVPWSRDGADVLAAAKGVSRLRLVVQVAPGDGPADEIAAAAKDARASVAMSGPFSAALADAWVIAADAHEVSLSLVDATAETPVPAPWTGAASVVGPARIEAARVGWRLPSGASGVAPADRLSDWSARAGGVGAVTRLLAATGAPVVGAELGGDALRGVGQGAVVHVVLPWLADRIAVGSTWPALVGALAEQGARPVLHSAWGDQTPQLAEGDARLQDRARARGQTFLRDLDLTGADAILAPGWEWATALLDHPTRPAGARLIVADDHLLSGDVVWRRRHPTWPDADVVVHTCFPGYAPLFARVGVPLERVVWRPYPIDPRSAALGPDPRVGSSLFAGGAHLRDGSTLIDALRGTHGRPVDVVGSRPQGALPDRLRHRDRLPLDAFYAQLQASRFVILTLEPDPHRAAGISVLALALAAGRPIVATATAATIDHLTHGSDALLVPAHDAHALREAIALLESDDDLLDRLATGARASAAKATVDAWARRIVHGSPPWPVDRGGTFGAW